MNGDQSAEGLPSGVLQDALFYIYARPGTIWEDDLSAKPLGRTRPFRLRSPNINREDLTMSATMQGWSHTRIALAPPAAEAHFSDLEIADAAAEQVPDVLRLHGRMLCSPAAQAVIDQMAPDQAEWVPVQLIGATSKAVLHTYAALVVRNHMFFETDAALAKPDLDFDPGVAEQVFARLLTDADARAYFEALDLWCFVAGADRPVFSRRLFHALKSAGLSGLDEKSNPRAMFYDGKDVIGHVS